jgi:23S rRNA (pseudouridine1915-N3)-methyltransferase
MNWKIITIGKPALSWAHTATQDYLKRIRRHSKLEWLTLKENGSTQNSKKQLDASQGCLRIVLDERGTPLTSLQLANWIRQQELQGTKNTAILIGGADGHTQELRAAADCIWTLSSFTLQHEVALVVLLEQLYRAGTILRGEPYHRE